MTASIPSFADRLSEDDQAVAASELFRAAALQRRATSVAAGAVPGTCANCGERCLPMAVYCDADCRDDHERREGRR